MRSVEKQGKTVDEAIELALQELEVARDEVKVEILDEGNRGFLGFLSRAAQVQVSVKQKPEEKAVEFLKDLISFFEIDIDINTYTENGKVKIEFKGERVGILIGKHGSTLDALQYLTSLVVNRNFEDFTRIVLDAENYRKKREKTLERLATRLARKVIDTKKSVTLEPMQPNERRIIHTALQDDERVNTKSIGEGSNRRIVISLNT